jgi:transcriptional regulator with XRE-family HTH domain
MRGGLTQDEMAFLLGCQSGAKVSRYERLSRNPNLMIIFAYQVIFGILPHELVPGIYQKVEHAIVERAERLSQKLVKSTGSPRSHQKIQALNAISSGKAVLPKRNL